MNIYMSRLFPRSNSSFLLSGGNALQSQVLRMRQELLLVDAGPGTPRICMEDELTRVPANRATTRFENKVGYLDAVAGELSIKNRVLERFFTDLVAGDPLNKERAAAKFSDLVGSTDAAPGEPLLILPRRFRQTQAWMELNKIWRTNIKVKGFIIEKVRSGYAVAIGGYIAFLPLRPFLNKSYGVTNSPSMASTLKTRVLVCSKSGGSNKGCDLLWDFWLFDCCARGTEIEVY